MQSALESLVLWRSRSRETLADACGLCELAEESGVLLAGVANKRFSPPYAQAKAIIEDGGLKSRARLFQGKFTLGYRDVDLLESGTVHMFDLALWFMGPAARVHARAPSPVRPRPENWRAR